MVFGCCEVSDDGWSCCMVELFTGSGKLKDCVCFSCFILKAPNSLPSVKV